ncbi:group III truncated hemoglobin [Roseomonas mucosa]|uniref:group III truncated hemoglobin n=1 Tax=Roseomonas mucosa TaxID=207340 RepID=UPI0028CF741D|nr:group III truncated hemoglobin [Roseomonas mucosa]MDT8278657.1 group III truncated hemoglobin [Roseomonas mucosa]
MDVEITLQPSEEDIRRLVTAFYARVRHDALLGPVFTGAIGEGEAAWERHLARLCDFWSSVMLKSGRYHGDPFSVHLRLSAISPAMFDRWLVLFGETCAELFAPPLAGAFCERAERIARSLRMGLFERLPTPRPVSAKDARLNLRRSA